MLTAISTHNSLSEERAIFKVNIMVIIEKQHSNVTMQFDANWKGDKEWFKRNNCLESLQSV